MSALKSVKDSFIAEDGLRLSLHHFGTPGGVPLVLHHGFAADIFSNWVSPGVVQRLLSVGRYVVGIDARGHGASDKPHDPAQYGHQVMANDVRALIDHLGCEHIDLCGYSMGGYVSLHVATVEPRVRSLAVGGVGEAAIGGATIDRTNVAEAMEAAVADPNSRSEDRTARQFVRFARATGADLVALAAQLRAPNSGAIPVGKISVPTLIIVGENDELAKGAAKLAAAIPGASFVVTPGDHLGAVAEPAFIEAICDWAQRRE